MLINGLHAIPHFEQTAPSDRVFRTLTDGAPIASRGGLSSHLFARLVLQRESVY
jgi:hypothetical protein